MAASGGENGGTDAWNDVWRLTLAYEKYGSDHEEGDAEAEQTTMTLSFEQKAALSACGLGAPSLGSDTDSQRKGVHQKKRTCSFSAYRSRPDRPSPEIPDTWGPQWNLWGSSRDSWGNDLMAGGEPMDTGTGRSWGGEGAPGASCSSGAGASGGGGGGSEEPWGQGGGPFRGETSGGGGDSGGRPPRDDDGEMGDEEVAANAGDLTMDLLHKVFSFLDQEGLCRASTVCRLWRTVGSHEDFWKCLNFEGRKVTKSKVTRLCKKFPKATDVNLRGVEHMDENFVQAALSPLAELESLKLGPHAVSDSFLSAVNKHCPNLLSLVVTDAVLRMHSALGIEFRYNLMRELHLVRCRIMRSFVIRCPLLEDLVLEDSAVNNIGLECPRLLHLNLAGCAKLADQMLRMAVTTCTSLQSLNIRGCAYVTDETLRDIANACTNLSSLDASFCTNLSLEGVRMLSLRTLVLSNCESINATSMAALSTFSYLETLVLDACSLLTNVSLELPRLSEISLKYCKKLHEVSIRSPVLEKVQLASSWPLNRIEFSSSVLERLSLSGHASLLFVELNCPQLRELDLSDCDNLLDDIFAVVGKKGGCPQLTSLTLDGCEGVQNVSLESDTIRHLSLTSCSKMESLSLACPLLSALMLEGCDHLAAAAFAPVALERLNLGICPRLAKLRVEAERLVHLDLRGCGALKSIAVNCPNLISLDASYCSQMGDDCLASAASACPSITTLVLASCPNITSAGLRCLRDLTRLVTLDVSYTEITELAAVFESCPSLLVLKLLACKWLDNDALVPLHHGCHLPRLRELDVSYCNLKAAAITALLRLCPGLTHVSLNGCLSVSDDVWLSVSQPMVVAVAGGGGGGSGAVGGVRGEPAVVHKSVEWEGIVAEGEGPAWMERSDVECSVASMDVEAFSELAEANDAAAAATISQQHADYSSSGGMLSVQTLNCVGCTNIRSLTLLAVAPCSSLTELNLSLCTKLVHAQLVCPNLNTLYLSQCQSLTSLKLDCPRLSNLYLQSCAISAEDLETAVANCPALETLDIRSCPEVSIGMVNRMRAMHGGIRRLHSSVSR